MFISDIILDFETRSRLEIKKVGSWKYSMHPSTEATLLTWCEGRTGTVMSWRPGQPIPALFYNMARNPHLFRFIAFNVAFDYAIWLNVMNKIIPEIKPFPIQNIDDGMALSCHFRTGGSLEMCAALLNLNMSKDKLGRTLMLKSCKPNGKGEFIELTPSEWVHFERYGKMDTEILRRAYYMLPPLPESERYAFEWTLRRNLMGIRVDMDLVKELWSIIEAEKPKLIAEFNWLVNNECGMNSTSGKRCAKDWFKKFYPWIENMAADTVRDMLAEDPRKVPYNVRRALEIKDLAGSTSIGKLPAAGLMEWAGRIYGLFAYHEAQSKRWAGRGINPQNFPRVDEKLMDPIDFNMDIPDLAGYVRSIRHTLKDPVGFVKNMLRRIWLPDEGETFYSGDWAKVEPAVLYWLCDLGPIPKKWYEEMAAEIYNMSPDLITKDSVERQVGKNANLSCQYGTGWLGFRTALYKATGIWLEEEEAKKVVSAYRRKHPEITKFWYDLEKAFRLALYGQTTSLSRGRVHVMPMQHPWRGVQIRLPSGSFLYYHQAREEEEEYEEEEFYLEHGVTKSRKVKKLRMVLTYLTDKNGRVIRKKVYSGLFCENVTSATARDLILPALYRVEAAGFKVPGLVHDEMWGSSHAGREEEFEYLMCINPSWCDMLIGAEVKSGGRYLK